MEMNLGILSQTSVIPFFKVNSIMAVFKGCRVWTQSCLMKEAEVSIGWGIDLFHRFVSMMGKKRLLLSPAV